MWPRLLTVVLATAVSHCSGSHDRSQIHTDDRSHPIDRFIQVENDEIN